MKDRYKQILYRCRHRGMKETDYLLGKFAEKHLIFLQDNLLSNMESLLDEPDIEIYNWIVGNTRAPDTLTKIVNKIRTFHGLS